MPHLRFRGLSSPQVQQISETLVIRIAELTQTPSAHFTCEWVATHFFFDGKPTAGEPFCEVLWFDRGAEMEKRVAQAITGFIQKLVPEKDVVVVFTMLGKNHYFENGEHF